jgi:flagellar L-ring protein precursor FlgH
VNRRLPPPLALVLAGLSLLAGGVPQPAVAKKPPPGFAPTLPTTAATARVPDGSIFNVNTFYAPLIEGARAHAVGDLINITLAETTTTSKSAAAKTQRTGGASITPPTAGIFALNPNALNASGQSSFNGQGNATQTSAFNGTIAVTVAEVRPNGTLLVRGEKRMMLSQGEEWIQISGIVRLADINPDTNSVLSSQLADANIVYSGNGSVQRAATEGWLLKLFNIVSPF